ncbi:MAG TPA: 1-deoxy-D-xylulose-5-phosphate reductoisomerase [Ktedonobacterales bacterium]|nr:1-deoxy-D-xylulose-5-phosphate reductoisomerase [Ktedonobacterales bacterium]
MQSDRQSQDQSAGQSEPRRIAILGSTGSIGRQTLDVVRAYPDRFEVVALAARSNVALLAEQAREFHPQVVVCTSDTPEVQRQLDSAIPGCLLGEEGLTTAATHPEVQMVVAATSGLVGVPPTLAAIRAGKTIALANKETPVMAGHQVMAEARSRGVEILPVDSEHNALWQCLRGERASEVRRLLITASGGPFRQRTLEEMRAMTPEQALAHPTWRMGPKVTIDSATLMNKGLEVIEAHWLYDMPYDKISVVVQPQSIIHSMVEYVDDSIKMQASIPSMRLPIQYALSYPDRLEREGTALAQPLRWSEIKHLEFDDADLERFPCLRLAYEAGRVGGSAPAALVGADETAVDLFLSGAIRFTDIAIVVERTLERHNVIADPDVEAVQAVSAWAQAEAARIAEELRGSPVSLSRTDD